MKRHETDDLTPTVTRVQLVREEAPEREPRDNRASRGVVQWRDLFGGAWNAAEQLVERRGPDWSQGNLRGLRGAVGAWLLMLVILGVPACYVAWHVPAMMKWLVPPKKAGHEGAALRTSRVPRNVRAASADGQQGDDPIPGDARTRLPR